MTRINQGLCIYLVLLTVYSATLADEWPRWQVTLEKKITGGIAENTAINTLIGTLNAIDPERQAVRYSGGGDVFSVDANSGSVRLKRNLDAEIQKFIPVTFFATDKADNQISAAYTLKVLDINDNEPIFQYLPYSPTLYEGDVNQTLVFDGVVAFDKDSGANAEIEFSCIETDTRGARACRMLSITGSRFGQGLYRGLIHLKQDLPDKSGATYTMTIQARDKGSDRKTVRTTITIGVNRIEATPPRLQNLPAKFTVFETDKAGSIVGEVAVAYPNATNNVPIGVRIERDQRDYFTMSTAAVEARQGGTAGDFRYYSRLILSKQFDRESIGDSYFFDIRAYDINDASRYSISTIGVEVGDANDNPPVFDKQTYQFHIPEGLPNGERLTGVNMVVTNIDSHEHAKYELSISEASFYSFKLVPRTGSETTSVSLEVDEARYLDYELPENRIQTLVIVARELQTVTPLSGSATVSIILQDRNDNIPKFDQSSFRASVREDRPPGYTIMTVTANDMDSGSYGKVTYSFEAGNSNFLVDKNTGEITLNRNLNFNTNPQLQATLRATDGDGKYADVDIIVSVRKYNEEGPEFEEPRYQARSERDSTILNPPVQVQASVVGETDVVIRYKIVEGNFNDAFIINEGTGQISLTKLVTKENTPGRSGFFTLIVEARISGSETKSNTVPVIISVLDSINNPPSFTETVIIKQMMENSQPGSLVAVVEANDNDDGQDGVVRYSIAEGAMGKFDIDPVYGHIRLARGATLDIERSLTSDYNMEVIAVDQGTPPLTATATVIVNVQDFNNKPPSFGQRTYRGSVLETQEVGTTVLTILASDPDSSAQLKYNIDDSTYRARKPDGTRFYDTTQFDYTSTFLLNPTTGMITTARRLDYNLVSELSFDVIATDTNGINQQDRATVVIYIQSSGIDYLIFVPPSQSINFNEEEPSGTVVTGLVAKDPRTQRPADAYEKLPGSDPDDYFFVNKTNGEITLTKRLDYETMPVKRIFVQMQASSTSGSSLKTAIGTVTVNVKDINDQFPIFNKNDYTFEVSELARYPTIIGQVRTTDKDTELYYRERVFTLTGPESNLFAIDSNTGDVSVSITASLDRERQEAYSLLVTATDNPNRQGSGEQRATTVQLVIKLLDKNDNEPKFSKSLYTIMTSENVFAGMILLNVQATDLDAGLNSKLTYRFNPPSVLFDVDNQGNIQTARDLGGSYSENPYVLNLQATDSAVNIDERLTGETVVHIYVEKGQPGDQGRPVITHPVRDYMEFHIEEEGAFSKYVMTIEAKDPEGEALIYRLLDNQALDHQDYFEIRNRNEIWTRRRLDREEKQKYEIVIEVIDTNPNPKGTIRTLFIQLTDIDDNRPGFDNCSEEIKRSNLGVVILPRNVPKNKLVTHVQACDDDAPPNNTIYYYITCGNTAESGDPPFRIDRTNGKIYTNTKLDKSQISQYKLCIYVTDKDREIGEEGKFDPDGKTPKGGTVVVIYIDESGMPQINLPSEGYISGFVLTHDTYGTEVSRVQTLNPNPNIIYKIYRQTFNGEDIEAFRIERNTGIIRTKKDNFYSYAGGHFELEVEAEINGRKTRVPVRMFVVDPDGKIRYRFQNTPEEVYKNYPSLMEEVRAKTDVILAGASLTYHVKMDGAQDDQSSDLCFYVIKDSEAISGREALSILDDPENTGLLEVYSKYGVMDIESCDRKLSSKWWGGWWWPWWVIIASAVFIIICAIILIIILFLFKDRRGPGMEWQSQSYYIPD